MTRALSSVVGVLLLLAVTVLVAVSVGAVATVDPGTSVPTASLSLSADADADRIALTHVSGETLDVTELTVTVAVDGERLAHQPPVPFFAAPGFESGPTGPFNVASDHNWTAGETAGVRVASTNDPQLSEGSRVEVTVATDAGVVASLHTTAHLFLVGCARFARPPLLEKRGRKNRSLPAVVRGSDGLSRLTTFWSSRLGSPHCS